MYSICATGFSFEDPPIMCTVVDPGYYLSVYCNSANGTDDNGGGGTDDNGLSGEPSSAPSGIPSSTPSGQSSGGSSSEPSSEPSGQPSGETSGQPSGEPSGSGTDDNGGGGTDDNGGGATDDNTTGSTSSEADSEIQYPTAAELEDPHAGLNPIDMPSMEVVKMVGDGNCLYYSCLHNKNGQLPSRESAVELCKNLALYIRDSSDSVLMVLSDGYPDGTTLKQYMVNSLRSSTVTISVPILLDITVNLEKYVDLLQQRTNEFRPVMWPELGIGLGWALATLLNLSINVYTQVGQPIGSYQPLTPLVPPPIPPTTPREVNLVFNYETVHYDVLYKREIATLSAQPIRLSSRKKGRYIR